MIDIFMYRIKLQTSYIILHNLYAIGVTSVYLNTFVFL
jgi:hypothetical protein